MNIKRLMAKFSRRNSHFKQYLLPAGLILLTLFTTYTLLTLLGVPRAPKLKNGTGNNLYVASNKIYSSTIGTKSGEPKITFSVGDSQIGYVLAGVSKVTPTKSGNTATFPDVQPDTDLHYTTTPNGIKEELIIKQYNKNTSNTYLFDLALNNVVPRSLTTGFIDPTFKDKNGNYRFHFDKPFAVDANGSRTDNVLLQIAQDKQLPGKYSLKLIVDEHWLSDPTRTYPVSIDPTVVHDTTTEFAAGQLNRLKDTGGTPYITGATGGTITTSGIYTIHTFTSSGTFTPSGSGTVEYLVVGAGGGGNLGGGGGGGVISGGYNVSSGVGYTVTVGTGTAGAAGGNSVFDTITASGGGQGGSWNQTGFAGGSGGGGGENDNQAGTFAGGAGTAGQGNTGGTTFQTAAPNGVSNGAGGGGAGANGGNSANGKTGGAGGAGIVSAISGSSVTYGGGGGGGATTSGSGAAGGSGGSGGGGAGAAANAGVNTAGAAGTANTGGGGGGGNNGGPGAGTIAGYAGGSGVVIVRYLTTPSPTLETYYQPLSKDQYTIGLWHLDENSGNPTDASGTGNTLTPTGTAVIGGLLNNARSFNGTTDYLSIADNASLSITGSLTWEAWIKATTTGDDRTVLIKRHSTTGFPALVMGRDNTTGYGTTGRWNFAVNVVTCGVITTTDGFDTNWHHIAGTYDGTTQRLYIDGRLSASGACSTSLDTDGAFQIGAGRYNTSAANYFPGIIDEVRISNVARTPEEIKAAAARRPYAVYTSDVIDIGGSSSFVTTWNPLQWSEHGVNTGDGETLKSSTNLVAQWNFNETSGTTADNAEGTAALDGTLTNFASTGSQDAATGTGWTSANKRWGAGALMFDGSNDYVTVADNNALDFGTADFSLEAWVKTTTAPLGQRIIYKYNSDTTRGYMLYLTYGKAGFLLWSAGANQAEVTSSKTINDGNWHHLVGLRKNSINYIYVDGKLEGTTTGATSDVSGASSLYIGSDSTPGFFHNGVIDSARIYSRAITPAEIMSNYQAGNIEFQTRIGSDASPDDGSWEAWRPTTSETAIETYDGPYQYNTTDSGLVSYLPMDETANDTCSGSQDACDRKSTNHGTSTGTKIVDGKFSKARHFNGSTEYIQVNDATNLDITGNLTIEAWVKINTLPGTITKIVGKWNETGNQRSYMLNLTSSNKFQFYLDATGAGSTTCSPNNFTATTGVWYHIVGVYDGTTCAVYVNGVLDSTAAYSSGIFSGSGNLMMGGSGGETTGGANSYLNANLDEVRIYNSAQSASTIQQHYLEGTTRPETLHPMTETFIKQEGSASQKTETGRTPLDGNTAALWHLDETGGTGAYIKDSSANSNHGTPAGTTVINGINAKARSFNGTSDKIDCTSTGMTTTHPVTLEAWAYFNIDQPASNYDYVIQGSTYGNTDLFSIARNQSDNKVYYVKANTQYFGPALPTGKWMHLAMVFRSSAPYVRFYLNGQEETISQPPSAVAPAAVSCAIGYFRDSTTHYLNGSVDEARISNSERSPEEIAEAYRAGRDHYLNKTISSTDLSGKTTLPFYVAADRPGTYLSTTVGESAFANYQPDTSTVGLWHLDEQSGSGAYLKDISGSNNHGTPTATTPSQGQIGKGRNFVNTTDSISVGDVGFVDGLTKMTISFWVYPTTLATEKMIISKGNFSSSSSFAIRTADAASDEIFVFIANALNDAGGNYFSTSNLDLTANQWTHIAAVYDGTLAAANRVAVYKNGQSISGTAIGTLPASMTSGSTTNLKFGLGDYAFQFALASTLDEMSISNVVRTASEIRQAYEVGLRTHPITIDFASAISHSDPLSSSSDLTFTLMATPSGTTNAGDNIYKGDKIIVRENYDGTEYLAQGTVDSVNVSTGATTVSAWDGSSTFPSVGFGPNSTVFKWQREYWNINNETLDSHTDAITNLTLRLTDGSEGRTIYLDDLRSNGDYLTTSSGSTITSSTGSRYMQYRAILSSFDEAVSATLSAVTVDYIANTPPTTPTLNAPSDTATNQLLSPVLQTTTTDADSDYIRYKIELCENLAMTTNCQTFDQTSSQTGWSGQNAQTNTAYTSGTQATYTIQTPLATATTYYWRSYGIDPAGTNTWSSTQGTPFSFTTTTAPSAPSTPWAEGSTNPTGVVDTTPEFSAIHSDPDSDAAVYYEIEVNTNNTFTGTVLWDTGAVAMSSLASGVRSTDVSYAGTAIPLDGAGTTYYWRIRFTDNKGAVSPFTTAQSFTMNLKANTPTLDSPSDGGLDVSFLPQLKTTATDGDSDYLRYKIELCENLAMTTNCQTFDQTVSQTGWSGQNAQTNTAYTSGTQATYTLTTKLTPNSTYFWRTYAIDPGGFNDWSNTQTPISFTTHLVYESFHCRIDESLDDTGLTVLWTDRELEEDSYKLEKSTDGAAFAAYQTLAANSTSYLDTTIAQGHTYQYRVAAFVNAGSTYGPWCTTNELTIEGSPFNFSGLNFNGLNLN